MREVFDFNRKWAFGKDTCEIPAEIPRSWNFVNLPHTWNAIDGQDGGNDYFRGKCVYAKELDKMDLPKADRYYLEIGAANSSADVYLNGKHLCHHDGGYSRFRVDVTDFLLRENLFCITVDNSENDFVYPEMADFTFYGGIYRKVNIICVSTSHFDLESFGGDGVKITPEISSANAKVEVEVWVKNKLEGQKIRYTVADLEGNEVVSCESHETKVDLFIPNVRLWQGRVDPYLYKLTCELLSGGEVVDRVESRFGCRAFTVDAERGFILNGKEYPLRGVSRHQDYAEIGNAISFDHHREDIGLIDELGATTVRLAHYQHDPYFYDLCDEYGIVVWAEIPYISKHMPKGRENTLAQMRELITQCYNHPSIAFWGLSNEITMAGDNDPDLLENHRILNELCHEMDKTRLTTVAAVSPCPIDSPYLKIPDLVAYNHYFGWYGGDVSMNGPWFDNFHAKHPEIPIGCSEYGCEGLNFHTSEPTQGDYTEEYQAYYHEELAKQLFSRKYLWATYVWNMFDFGADARSEGGECGQNHKGLVTINRKYKKDAFFIYKAWLSDKPFVHIAGKRYVDRVENVTRVTVYSNLPEVELIANGKSLGKKKGEDHIFRFEVENVGVTKLLAVSGECFDRASIRKVDKFNQKYILRDKSAILNWYDVTEREGYLSVNSKMSEILATEGGRALLSPIMAGLGNGAFEVNESMMEMMGGFTLLRLVGMLGTMGKKFTKEELLSLNERLNSVKKDK